MVKLTEEMLASKAERSRTVRDAYEQAGQQDRGPRVDWGVVTLQSIEAMRSDATLLRHYRSLGMSNEQVLAEVGQNDSDDRRIVLSRIKSLIHKEAGTSCFKAGDFSGAIVEYEAALRALVGPNAVFPSRKYFDDQYMTGIRWRTGGSSFDTPGAAQETVTADVPLFIDLIALAGNIAQCYVRLGKYLEAIDWTQETEVIMNVARIHLSYDVWVAWRYPFPNVQEFWNIRLKHYKRCIDIFLALGNTATAAAYTLTLTGENSTLPDETTKPFPALHKLRHDVFNPDVFMRRHPEPNVSEAKVQHPDLQVLGVWERQQYASGSQKPGGRLYSSVWIWKGSMYVAGGTATPAHNERDIVGLTDTWFVRSSI
ncbi:hypothetical protein EXIGLDRAFT_726174 [Exidia glandulosa HHB12029]|uniref:TPR-like protein n=1 Tax=Exidia glandulosa HHB12029 TaxID=1314781 RepID=A0A165MCU8_EXIGL|nr:hypothetical protein EXIGLDRAFT_726174 [Exidia glandulosa HHB12029]